MTITMKVNDEEFSPELAMAMQFEFIKKLSITMGDGLVKDCSITVPSYWTIAQRLAVLNAADAAKLNVVTLVSENTAAGFYYAIDRLDEKDYHAIIYNLGSWNLEVSVLKYNTAVKHITKHTNKTIENVEVLAHSWDQSFGGRTIDTLIADDLMDGFKEKYGVDPRLKPKSVAKFMK